MKIKVYGIAYEVEIVVDPDWDYGFDFMLEATSGENDRVYKGSGPSLDQALTLLIDDIRIYHES